MRIRKRRRLAPFFIAIFMTVYIRSVQHVSCERAFYSKVTTISRLVVTPLGEVTSALTIALVLASDSSNRFVSTKDSCLLPASLVEGTVASSEPEIPHSELVMLISVSSANG